MEATGYFLSKFFQTYVKSDAQTPNSAIRRLRDDLTKFLASSTRQAASDPTLATYNASNGRLLGRSNEIAQIDVRNAGMNATVKKLKLPKSLRREQANTGNP